MARCPACRETIPDDVRYCGFCGFKRAPISTGPQGQEMLSTPALARQLSGPDEPLLLTRRKRPSDEAPPPAEEAGPRLEIVDEGALAAAVQGALDDRTVPAASWSPAAGAAAPSPLASDPALAQTAPRPALAQDTRTPARVSSGRRFPRFPLKVEVSYTSEHNFFTGFLENVSNGGLFVATHTPGKIGDVLEVTFSVPGLPRACVAVCRVKWVREYDVDNPDSVPGMGLQFSQLEPDVRAAIEAFVRHREPIFYDE